MSESIPPALTKEEWERGSIGFEYWGTASLNNTGELHVRSPDKPAIFKAGERHGLAALCLHQQPFGFHRAEVHYLRVLADLHERYAGEGKDPQASPLGISVMRDVADKIEALLPPEDVTP